MTLRSLKNTTIRWRQGGIVSVLILAGCQGIFGGSPHPSAPALQKPAADAADPPAAVENGENASPLLVPADRAVFARHSEKDAKGRNHCVWIREC